MNSIVAWNFCAVVCSPSSALLLEDLPHSFNAVGILGRLVGTQPDNTRESERISALVPVGTHHVIESYFQNDLGLDNTPESLIFDRVLQKPRGHLQKLSISETGISFPDVNQSVSIPNRKRVITQYSNTFAMAELGSGDHDVKSGEFTLHFEPCFTTLAWAIGRI